MIRAKGEVQFRSLVDLIKRSGSVVLTLKKEARGGGNETYRESIKIWCVACTIRSLSKVAIYGRIVETSGSMEIYHAGITRLC